MTDLIIPNRSKIIIDGPAALVTSMPYQLGFHPKHSIIMVNLLGPAIGLVERMDIPPAEKLGEAVDGMIEPILRLPEKPSEVVLLGYEDVEGESTPILNAIQLALSTLDIGVFAVVVVRDGFLYQPCKNGCCLGEAIPLEESSAVAAEFVMAGKSPSATRADVVARVESKVTESPVPKFTKEVAFVAMQSWAKLLTGEGTLEAEDVAAMASSLTDIDMRDGILVTRITPMNVPAGAMKPELLDLLNWLPELNPEGAIDRFITFASSLTDEHAAPALTLLGTYAWKMGDGALTQIALDRAARCDSTYRLAQLLQTMLTMNMRPF